MKMCISLGLCVLLLLGLCACGADTQTPTETTQTQPTIDPNAPLCDGKTLKMLCITSSFGLNTTELLYDIAKDQGAENVIIARLYVSGCKLSQHAQFAKTGEPAYQYTKNSTGKWEKMMNATLLYGLQDEDWDIIFLQQGAHHAGLVHTYGDYIDEIMAFVQENKTNPNARFVWNMTWAFQSDNTHEIFMTNHKGDQMVMYNMILDTVKEKVVPRDDFSAIIPSGTAVQNARTSYFGDTLTKDTLHLNNLGRVIAGYTTWATLTGKPIEEINLPPARTYDLPEVVVLTETDKAVIIEAVNNAIANPWAVTPSTYTEKPQ
jgi:hypothetical protein